MPHPPPLKKREKEKKEKNGDWSGVAERVGRWPDAGGNPCKSEKNTG